MRVYFSYIVTVSAALLLVSGTAGCRSNGGPWYNPATYSFSNPFGKESPGSPKSSSMANTKPSLDAQPNISTPRGGYTDSSSYVDSSGVSGGTTSSSPPQHWASQSPVAQQNAPNSYGGHTTADPSQYSPYTYTESYGGPSGELSHAAIGTGSGMGTTASSPYQYQPEAVQHAYNNPSMPYGEQHTQTAYHATSAYQQQPTNNVPPGAYGNTDQQGQYATFGTTPPSDPYTAAQQPTAVPPSNFGYDQPASAPYTYPSDGVPNASPYQPYPPPAVSSGYNF